MVKIEYRFSPENLSDKQVIFPNVVPEKKPYCSPVSVGTEDNPATASSYLCFYRVDTGRYYGTTFRYDEMDMGANEFKVVVTSFIGPYEFSSEIPPTCVIPVPDVRSET